MPRTADEIAQIDRELSGIPAERGLCLWERLREAGDVPPLTPELFRELLWALYCAQTGKVE